jgi:polysaccharide export outer membrane protein
MKKALKILAFVAVGSSLLAFGCGCSTVWSAIVGPDDSDNVDVDQMATYFDGEPMVRPGVALAISVTSTGSSGTAAKQYFVDAEGYITMELVGRIKCDGLTLVGLQEKIAAAYKEYLLEPHVTATFIYHAGQNMVSPWGTVTVLGEVGKPGPVDVPSTLDLRVTRALQLAGGVNAIADKRRVQVTRCDKDGKRTKTKIDLLEIGEEGRPDKDMLLRAGDVVWVPMSWY